MADKRRNINGRWLGRRWHFFFRLPPPPVSLFTGADGCALRHRECCRAVCTLSLPRYPYSQLVRFGRIPCTLSHQKLISLSSHVNEFDYVSSPPRLRVFMSAYLRRAKGRGGTSEARHGLVRFHPSRVFPAGCAPATAVLLAAARQESSPRQPLAYMADRRSVCYDASESLVV